ncbi:MAG: class I SAM-dependent DNA methyltransferase [Spirochaetaceae bacterium]|nr:class I SAM-dependent DNA methyltransferase [Spirochaetaceae bacterium]
MTQIEQTQHAKDFSEYWKDKGDEKQESQRYWIGLLGDVLGIANATNYIEFEKKVKLKHTSFIDAYISSTKVLIEQKGAKVDLTKPQEQSDGAMLTPYQQAKRYADELSYDLKPRWIVVSNFKEIHIHDMNNLHAEPEIILLENLEKEYYRLQFLVDTKNENIRREEEISLQAGILVGKLYDALIKEYINPDESSLRSLNILCVRLVFCFYAEDAGLFETRTSFEDYIKSFNLPNLRKAMIDLFKGLDTKLENRDKYDTSLKAFPYVNGGLFAAEDIEIPNFTQEIVDVLVNDCAPFDWREISPTIFGAVFESTLNPETRRTGGMHYTSIENIHKVIDPLFMDELEAEFEKICATTNAKTKSDKLHAFQEKLGNLKFLDPACGSGNFLTETYLSIRRLENKVISVLNNGEKVLGFDEFIKVKINQFYGIEINDFAVTVAKTALWIAESQMMTETEKIIGMNLDFLPLTTNAFIVEGNALRMNWATLKPIDENVQLNDGLFAGFATEVDGNEIQYDYIMGNPPFVGARLMSTDQKNDVISVWGNIKNIGNVDYVSCWYKKAANLMKNSNIKTALVSTNSITQGEQVAIMWKPLMEMGVKINFAYRTFRWDSESTQKAHVHCVIVGFSCHTDSENLRFSNEKRIYNSDGTEIVAKNINGYLVNADDIFIESRTKPLCDVPEIGIGNKPIDGGNYLFSEDEMKDFIKKEPLSEKYFKCWLGAEEFINNKKRYCLWLGDCSPNELLKMPECLKRVQAVREFRLASKSEGTRKLAEKPTRFHVENMPDSNYLLIPRVSSEKREYVPIGYINSNILCSDSVHITENAALYHFAILTSSVHMAWMRTVCGRLEMRYRYSKDIVYNNFPWCNPTDEQKAKIEKTAQAILDARAKYPDCSLAQLYGENSFLFPELVKAHQANDRAVMEAYGFAKDMTESEIVAELFKMYEKLTEGK